MTPQQNPSKISAIFRAIVAPVVGLRRRTTSRTGTDADPTDRDEMREAAKQVAARCRRTRRPLTVVRIDLDGFRRVNEEFGWEVGDRLLRLCVTSWGSQIGDEDLLARIEGDEFLLLLPGCDRVDAELLIERLRRRSPCEWSFGCARLRADEGLAECFRRAGIALGRAKELGGSNPVGGLDTDDLLAAVGFAPRLTRRTPSAENVGRS
jgi:diguanylate cyclase (GGDEF)-like protein